MLNRAERFKILKFIQKYCTIGCFPAIVDLSTWQLLQHSATGRRSWPSLTYFGLFMLHVLYKTVTLVGACFTQNPTPIHEFIIHAILAVGGLLIGFWYYQLFIKNPGAFGCFLRLTVTGSIGGTIAEGTESKKIVIRLREYTMQDLLALSLPYMVAVVIVAIIGTYIYCPTIQLLLYAGLPTEFKTSLSFVILLLEEFRYLVMCGAVALLVWTLQVISFELVNHQLKLLIVSVRRTATRRALQFTYSYLRRIQLYISIINVVNRYIIFSWKILCITFCITSGYAGIAHFSDHPVFGVMYYYILIEWSLIYIISYGKAFRIPALFKEASEQAVLGLGLREGSPGDDMQIFKRQMRSIPPVGIKIGEFHVLERKSTPAFVDFVSSNIVSMLVAFRH